MPTEGQQAAMAQQEQPQAGEAPIRAVRLPTQLTDLELLIPYALIAEITDVSLPEGSIRLGRNEATIVNWRGQRVPLVSLEAMNGETVPTIGRRVRCAILYGTDPDRALPYYALLLSGVPRSEQVERRQIETAGPQDNPLWHAVVRLDGRLTAIPNIRVLEERIDQMRLGEEESRASPDSE
ncbi:chemotaxis protein CheW [Guyparkeria sp. TX1]|uniref:chemotaxis protein CheW n=1 Tax=Guyparkeria sp. TX1 TaxID=3115001 RepID=UPI0039774033